ncbi:CcoQ/FixQ family Cbb3-type cytochrome c oxidase assembly chaperone [Parafilimonas sp.]|uniref:CcoQ/FixQ family Cbb3-type cytochrome c oxidase assembly chaperone n=1 Tax=Parafilimonas sp. TaxID=1969739 RepID=UPI003F7FC096
MSFIHYLESITGVSIYALISFGIFFSFFIVMSLWAWKADKQLIKTLSNIPLDDSQDIN